MILTVTFMFYDGLRLKVDQDPFKITYMRKQSQLQSVVDHYNNHKKIIGKNTTKICLPCLMADRPTGRKKKNLRKITGGPFEMTLTELLLLCHLY